MFQDRLSRKALSGLFLCGLLVAACGDDNVPSDSTTTTTSAGGTGGTGAQGGTGGQTGGTGGQTGGTGGQTGGTGGAGGAPDCNMNPMTHVEIINACTDAEKIDKQPVLPLLNPDGSLPPLP